MEKRHYTTKAAFIEDIELSVTADCIVETTDAQSTGLLNADGVPLYRVKESVPFGFHPHKP